MSEDIKPTAGIVEYTGAKQIMQEIQEKAKNQPLIIATFNIKSKTSGKCRVYPDSPNGMQPSVTSICGALMKYGLIDWAANCAVDYIKNASFTAEQAEEVYAAARQAHNQIKDEAADFGTLAHLLIQLYLEHGEGVEVDDEFGRIENEDVFNKVSALYGSFKDWATKNKIEPVHTEIKLHGDGYSGRCDLIAYRTCPKTGERRLGLYDIKTGKGQYYPEWSLQVCAYADAADKDRSVLESTASIYDKAIEEIGIIKLNKDTLKCNFSEQSKPKFTADRDRLTRAWGHLVKFYWEYNDLAKQFSEIDQNSIDTEPEVE